MTAGMDSRSEHTLLNRVVQGCTLDVVYFLVTFGWFYHSKCHQLVSCISYVIKLTNICIVAPQHFRRKWKDRSGVITHLDSVWKFTVILVIQLLIYFNTNSHLLVLCQCWWSYEVSLN